MTLLAEPFAYEFFRQGLLASVLVGFVCGLIGVYVVLRHMSYIGHGLSHAVFGGAVVAYVLGTDQDPQGFRSQRDQLVRAGCIVTETAARASLVAAALATGDLTLAESRL